MRPRAAVDGLAVADAVLVLEQHEGRHLGRGDAGAAAVGRLVEVGEVLVAEELRAVSGELAAERVRIEPVLAKGSRIEKECLLALADHRHPPGPMGQR
jgi:hypothetical protein